MKSEKIIEGFTAKLNPEKVGLKIKAYVFLREDPSQELRRLNELEIKKLNHVGEFYRLFGRYSVEVLVKDGEELENFVKRIHRLKGVRETETFIVHSIVKNEPQVPFLDALRQG